MTDLFLHLAAQSMGIADSIRPLVAPCFAANSHALYEHTPAWEEQTRAILAEFPATQQEREISAPDPLDLAMIPPALVSAQARHVNLPTQILRETSGQAEASLPSGYESSLVFRNQDACVAAPLQSGGEARRDGPGRTVARPGPSRLASPPDEVPQAPSSQQEHWLTGGTPGMIHNSGRSGLATAPVPGSASISEQPAKQPGEPGQSENGEETLHLSYVASTVSLLPRVTEQVVRSQPSRPAHRIPDVQRRAEELSQVNMALGERIQANLDPTFPSTAVDATLVVLPRPSRLAPGTPGTDTSRVAFSQPSQHTHSTAEAGAARADVSSSLHLRSQIEMAAELEKKLLERESARPAYPEFSYGHSSPLVSPETSAPTTSTPQPEKEKSGANPLGGHGQPGRPALLPSNPSSLLGVKPRILPARTRVEPATLPELEAAGGQLSSAAPLSRPASLKVEGSHTKQSVSYVLPEKKQEFSEESIPDIHIHIGRIEVRATSTATSIATKRAAPARPALSLSAYLEQRGRNEQ